MIFVGFCLVAVSVAFCFSVSFFVVADIVPDKRTSVSHCLSLSCCTLNSALWMQTLGFLMPYREPLAVVFNLDVSYLLVQMKDPRMSVMLTIRCVMNATPGAMEASWSSMAPSSVAFANFLQLSTRSVPLSAHTCSTVYTSNTTSYPNF